MTRSGCFTDEPSRHSYVCNTFAVAFRAPIVAHSYASYASPTSPNRKDHECSRSPMNLVETNSLISTRTWSLTFPITTFDLRGVSNVRKTVEG